MNWAKSAAPAGFALGVALSVSLSACSSHEPPRAERRPTERGHERAKTETTTETQPRLDGARVLDETERRRMAAYAEGLYPREAVLRSITLPSGDEVDCVDVHEQPGLRRPGMEDHALEYAPRTAPLAPADRPDPAPTAAPDDRRPRSELSLVEPCPAGTIPIRRLSVATLARFETLEDFRRKIPEREDPAEYSARLRPEPPQQGATELHQYAHAYRWVGNMGAESNLNLWGPHVASSGEFSLSQIWVARGQWSTLETVEVGWQTYPNLYGDWNARLFIYFTPDNYGSGGCYNLSCAGFVQTSNSVLLGGAFADYSEAGKDQYAVRLFWYKDGPEGHWWLRVDDHWIGYYPRSLFDADGLRDRADVIDFGGEIIDIEDGVHTHTDMGSGAFAGLGWQHAAYQRNIRYVDLANYWQRATDLIPDYNNPWCYDILLYDSGAWKDHFFFGGSGFNASCQ